jgi:hemerythrin
MKQFQWSDAYKLGIPIIDEQHIVLVSIINKASKAVVDSLKSLQSGKEKKEYEDAKAILDELYEYAKLHFSTEEKFFREFHYEKTNEHKAQHRAFYNQLQSFKKNLTRGESSVSMEIFEYLQHWFVDHLIGFDREYVECFHRHGL